MKKIIVALAVVVLAINSKAGNPEFLKVMGETLSQYQTCRSVNDFQALANKFERIASAEKGEWLPLYYHAHCYIIMSFMEQTDTKKKDEYLDVAEKSINKMIELVPNESEVYALQSMYYSARLVVNPMERGQKYSALSAQAVGMSLGIDGANPRARFIKLRNDMGTAQFFGRDPKEYCPDASELLASWDSYKLKSPIYPAWGKDQVAEIVNECK